MSNTAQPIVIARTQLEGALDALATLRESLMADSDWAEVALLSDRIIMPTNGPSATIGEILTVDLPRPRNRLTLAENPHYHHLRGQQHRRRTRI